MEPARFDSWRARRALVTGIALACGAASGQALASTDHDEGTGRVRSDDGESSPSALPLSAESPSGGGALGSVVADRGSSDDETRWAAFPVVSASPETSWLFGGFAAYHFKLGGESARDSARRSRLMVFAAYTLKRQFVMVSQSRLYTPDAHFRLDTYWSGLWFPDRFYAIGRDSPNVDEAYTQQVTSLSLSPAFQASEGLWLGVSSGFVVARMVETEPGGLLASGAIRGSRGGKVVYVGPVVGFDDRDRDMAARSGGLRELAFRHAPRVPGTDMSFSELTFDLRQHLTTWRDQVLSLQGFAQFHWGQVPFQLMASMAGSSRMRGMFERRFIDRHAVSAQVEYRVPFSYVAAVAFASVGQVGAEVANMDLLHPHVAGGGGVRIRLNRDDGVNLRVDVGHASTGDTNLYVNVGEAF